MTRADEICRKPLQRRTPYNLPKKWHDAVTCSPKMALEHCLKCSWIVPSMVLERRLDRPTWPRFFVICVLKGILVKMEPALIPIVLVFIFHFYQNAYRIYIYIYQFIQNMPSCSLEHTWVHYFSDDEYSMDLLRLRRGTTITGFSLAMGSERD